MRIVKPLVVIEDDLNMVLPNGKTLREHMLKKIELFARLSHRSEGLMTEESYKTFVPKVYQHLQHEGIVEHRSISIRFIFDRGVSHEGVRHRISSFLQESTRYCDYAKDGKHQGVTYVLPPWVNPVDGDVEYEMFKECCHTNELMYQHWRERGWKPEQSRGWLAHFVKTEYVDTKDLVSWVNFCRKRANRFAHPSMRQVAIPTLLWLKAQLPEVFSQIPVPEFEFGTEKLAEVRVNPYYDQGEPEMVYSD